VLRITQHARSKTQPALCKKIVYLLSEPGLPGFTAKTQKRPSTNASLNVRLYLFKDFQDIVQIIILLILQILGILVQTMDNQRTTINYGGKQ
jgi:hypothetical protein